MSLTALVHDAVLLWAYSVNRTLSKSPPGAPDDGLELTRIMIEEIGVEGFDGILGQHMQPGLVGTGN